MSSGYTFPPHAYIPGKTARHPEGAFDAIRETAQPEMTVAELANCNAFQTGLEYLEEGFFWEAHEVLEPVWFALPESSGERQFVQGLIQIANGYLKLRMERPNAARRLCGIAGELIGSGQEDVIMHQSRARFLRLIEELEHAVSAAG